MRTVLFVHNGPLFRSADGRLYGTHITDELRRRYLLLGDRVHFLMREKSLHGTTEQYSRIQAEDFEFTSVPDILSPKKRLRNHTDARRIISAAVRAADVVVARIPSIIGRWAVNAARREGKPYMLECVACNWDALSNHKPLARVAAPWYFYAQKRVVGRAPFVIYVTQEFLQRRYPTRGRSYSISNVELPPVDQSVLHSRLERIADNRNSEDTLRLVTVANVATPYKGQADIIRTLPLLRKKGLISEYHLVGAGDPTRLAHLAEKHAVREHVVFHGAVRHDRVFELLDCMDLYIQPSRQEGLPRALIEAMSRGMPALGATTGGIPELLPAERVFPAGNRRKILDGIIGAAPRAAQRADAIRNFERAREYDRRHLQDLRARAYSDFLATHGLLDAVAG